MIKKRSVYLISCTLLLLVIIKFPIFSQSHPLLPIDGITPGITKVEQIKDSGRLREFDNGKGTSYRFYSLQDLSVYFEDEMVNGIKISLAFQDFPENWLDSGFNKDMNFFEWTKLFEDQGYTIQVEDYPEYLIKGATAKVKGLFSVVHTDFPSILITLHFSNSSLNPDSNFKSEINQIKIELRDPNELFQEKKLYPNDENIQLAPAQREAIAYSGLLGEVNRANQEKLESFNLASPHYRKKTADMLDGWGISTSEDLYQMLEDLRTGGHSSSLLELLDIIENQDTSLLEYATMNNLEQYKARRLIFLLKYKNLPGLRERSLRAWDFGRSISLCRWAYNAGYISESEAWEEIQKCRKDILDLYNSWEDYAANFTLGRMFWASSSIKAYEKGSDIFRVFTQLSFRENSVWNGPWDIEDIGEPDNDYQTKMIDIVKLKTIVDYSLSNFYEGLDFYKAELYEDAVNEFTLATKAEDFFFPHVYLGFIERNLNNIDKAEEHFKIFYENHQNDYFGAIYYGEACEDNNNLTTAVSVLKSAILINPQFPQAYKSLARIYMSGDDYDKAKNILDEYDLSVTDDKQFFYADYLKGAIAFNRKNYQLGISNFLKCYSYYKENGYVNYLLGSCYLYIDERESDFAYTYLSRAEKKGVNLSEEILQFLREWESSNSNILTEPIS